MIDSNQKVPTKVISYLMSTPEKYTGILSVCNCHSASGLNSFNLSLPNIKNHNSGLNNKASKMPLWAFAWAGKW